MVKLILGVCLLIASAGPEPSDSYPKNPTIDALNYAFRFTLSDTTDEIVGDATIDIRFLSGGQTRVRLDLINQSSDGRGMAVTGVTSSDGPVTFTHENDELFITLARPTRANQRSSYTVSYRGIAATGLIIGPNKYGDRTFFSDNWPNKARNWLPTIDHPYDKATSEFIVTAPSHYQVVSNGLQIEQTDLSGGMRLTHWKQSVPIATWLYNLGVARFAVQQVGNYQGRAIQTWVYYQDREAGFYDFAEPTRQVLEFYGEWVGPYSYEKLANIQSNSVGGGMEAATSIFYGDNSVTGDRSVRWRNVVIHEIAHQWFGNAVTESDWDDVWLSEGFATYFTLLFREHQYGRDDFLQGLRESAARVWSFYEANPDYRIVHDNLDDMSRVTSSQTYQKGGWTLHMLRGVIGENDFWKGIREYYRLYRDKNASTDDFRRAMEEASGQDLQQFFHQWLYQGGALEYQGGWSYDPEAGSVEVELTQVQDDGYTFAMPVQIGIYTAGEAHPRIEVLQVDEVTNRFTIPVGSEPTQLVLDPNAWVLMKAEFARRK